MNEYEKLNTLMDEFKQPEDIADVVKTLSVAEIKRFLHILEVEMK